MFTAGVLGGIGGGIGGVIGAVLGFHFGQVGEECGLQTIGENAGTTSDCVNRLGINFGDLMFQSSAEEASIVACTLIFAVVGIPIGKLLENAFFSAWDQMRQAPKS